MDRKKAIDITFFLLRIVAGFLFVLYGTTKLFGWFGGVPPQGGSVPLMSEAGVAGVLELVGGILIFFGLLTRPTAFILSGEMAVAYFQMHQPKGLLPSQNMGTPAVLFCFIYLFMAAYGAGPWSLDALFRRKSI
jgi:putative oxidoreductase